MVLSKQGKYKESLDCDKIIIKKLDKTFEKSYPRMIDHYLKLNNFNLARYHYSLMKAYCPSDSLTRYKDIIEKIESEIGKKDTNVNGLLQLKSLLK